MAELTVLEAGLVPVYLTDNSQQICNGRELWQALQSRTDFSTWIKRRLNECEAAESEDYWVFFKNGENLSGGRPNQEYLIQLDIAKEMAMLERNEVGKQVRKYFISVEKKHKQQMIDTAQLSPQMQLLSQMVNNMAAQELKVKEIESKLEQTEKRTSEVQHTLRLVQDTFIQQHDDGWRDHLNKLFNQAVEASGTGDYQGMRRDTYDELERRAHCDLERRLRYMHDRMYEQGATKTQIQKTGRLDVIEADPKLKEIYTTIIKELSIRYASGDITTAI